MKPILIALIATLSGSASLVAETSQVRAKRVLDQCLEALGGARFLAVKDVVSQGRTYGFYRDKLTGLAIATIYMEYLTPSPGKLTMREREDYGKKKDSGSVLFTPEEAYQITFRGAQPLPKERFERYQETTMRDIFYILHQRRDEPGMLYESRGADVFDNRPVEIVDITDSANLTMTVYIDSTTHLPIRQVFYRRNPIDQEKDEETTLYTKYRETGGVMWPFTIERDRNGDKVRQIFSETVKINQGLKEDLFSLPNGIKMLKSQ
jgi:hypothetical protein